ncbi:hypothetical protein [Acinetobacter sp. ANC 3903]|uniref:hypothetical protein n=1 Tax=Acinetobacter sp. ANC 3903 TaxID=1977883 RepID=UPI001D1781F3|nr:hypothetical protein [Acinetobacter sp. ANC 3903]
MSAIVPVSLLYVVHSTEIQQDPPLFRYFSPRATETGMNHPDVIEMNLKLGVKIDKPEFVAKELYQFM